MVAHSFLKDDPHLETVSIGAGKNRRIVIKYKE
jgi:predicted RNA-binding protein Jag